MKLSTLFKAFCKARYEAEATKDDRGMDGIAVRNDKDALHWRRKVRQANRLERRIANRISDLEKKQVVDQ